MDGVTAMRKGQQPWSHALSEREMAAQRATQGGGKATKGDATTSHQSEREVNERRKEQADKRWRGNDEEGHVVLLSEGGGSAVPTGANGDTQGILRQQVRPAGDGDGRMRRGG